MNQTGVRGTIAKGMTGWNNSAGCISHSSDNHSPGSFQARDAFRTGAVAALVEPTPPDAADGAPVARGTEQHIEHVALRPTVKFHIFAVFRVIPPERFERFAIRD